MEFRKHRTARGGQGSKLTQAKTLNRGQKFIRSTRVETKKKRPWQTASKPLSPNEKRAGGSGMKR